jgi:dTDP-4-amino-4,6-dideoxygalactose transaminase
LYVVRSPFRDSLRKALENSGIGSGIHYPVPVHLQPAYRGRVPLGVGGLTVSEALAREVLSLPMHPFLSARDLERVIAAVANWAKSGRGREE